MLLPCRWPVPSICVVQLRTAHSCNLAGVQHLASAHFAFGMVLS